MKVILDKFRVIAAILLIVIVAVPQSTYADSDTPSNWAKSEVYEAIEKDVVQGKILGDYKSNITREEFSEAAVKLYEALYGEEAIFNGNYPFTDTQNEQIMMAHQLNIVSGIGDGKFAPYNNITREEISVMLYRTLQASKPELNYSVFSQYSFSDSDLISNWAQEAIDYLYNYEIINGVGDNQFNPKGNTSREEAIVLVNRMYEKASEIEVAESSNYNVSRGSSSRNGNDLKVKLASLIAQEMGKPYKWGGIGPDSYDCSGLVYSLFGKLNISLPRTSREQATSGVYVSKEDLTYGDLVFFASNGKTVNHVGIYVGNGEFVHAPNSGEVVKVSTLMSGYYANTYYTGRRVLP